MARYCEINFKSKKALKEALAKGEKIATFSPSPFDVPKDGIVGLEGPHYPAPHSWYTRALIKDNVIVKLVA